MYEVFCSVFSSIAMAWCIINSCHKVARSITNTTLELCADCAKQFDRNAQDCGKINNFAHTSMRVREFLAKNEIVIMPQPSYSPDLAGFNLPKTKGTPMKEKPFATIEEINEKSKQDLFVIPKSVFQKCFEDSQIRLHIFEEALL